jgi:hypothetical protein
MKNIIGTFAGIERSLTSRAWLAAWLHKVLWVSVWVVATENIIISTNSGLNENCFPQDRKSGKYSINQTTKR